MSQDLAIDVHTGEAIQADQAIRPVHRIIVSLHLKGLSNQEIADTVNGFTYESVSEVITSPWARKQIAQTLAHDANAVQRILEATNLDNVYTLQRLRDTAESENVRLNAAKELLHMAMGKPTQRTKLDTSDLNKLPPEQEDAVLRQEIADIVAKATHTKKS